VVGFGGAASHGPIRPPVTWWGPAAPPLLGWLPPSLRRSTIQTSPREGVAAAGWKRGLAGQPVRMHAIYQFGLEKVDALLSEASCGHFFNPPSLHCPCPNGMDFWRNTLTVPELPSGDAAPCSHSAELRAIWGLIQPQGRELACWDRVLTG